MIAVLLLLIGLLVLYGLTAPPTCLSRAESDRLRAWAAEIEADQLAGPWSALMDRKIEEMNADPERYFTRARHMARRQVERDERRP